MRTNAKSETRFATFHHRDERDGQNLLPAILLRRALAERKP